MLHFILSFPFVRVQRVDLYTVSNCFHYKGEMWFYLICLRKPQKIWWSNYGEWFGPQKTVPGSSGLTWPTKNYCGHSDKPVTYLHCSFLPCISLILLWNEEHFICFSKECIYEYLKNLWCIFKFFGKAAYQGIWWGMEYPYNYIPSYWGLRNLLWKSLNVMKLTVQKHS